MAMFDENTAFIVVSDDMEWAKENIKGPNVAYSPFDDEIMDFYLMTQCNNGIISNSSFSWWGAWLNANLEKIVIAPKLWWRLLVDIESALAELQQLTDMKSQDGITANTTFEDMLALSDQGLLMLCKTFVGICVRLSFDPPSGSVLNSLEKSKDVIASRITVQTERGS
jgi:hypothetical protein